MDTIEEKLLPKEILAKAIKSGNEFGWKKEDFIDVVYAAKSLNLATIGGQVQFVFPDGTCELYWLKYDPEPQKDGETWERYCERSANECIKLFKKNCSDTEGIVQEAIKSFIFIQEKIEKGQVDLKEYLYFIAYFASEKNKYGEG